MIFAELPQTDTRKRTNSDWAYLAVSGNDPESGDPIMSVTVLEFRGVRITRRVVDRYVFEPASPQVGPAGVAFSVWKTHHSGDEDTVRGRKSGDRVGEVYHCEVGPGYHRCSCTGGATEGHRPGGSCVHVLVTKDLIQQDAIGPELLPAPGERAHAECSR